jgi:hypothetical protein
MVFQPGIVSPKIERKTSWAAATHADVPNKKLLPSGNKSVACSFILLRRSRVVIAISWNEKSPRKIVQCAI